MKTLQRIGKSFMVPIALLPAAGIFLGFGAALQNPDLISFFTDGTPGAFYFGFVQMLKLSGEIVFANLPLLFAIGVATGLSDDRGVPAMAAAIGFLVMNVVIGVAMPKDLDPRSYTQALGIHTLNTGVFGGIVVGLMASFCYKRFYQFQMPDFLSFFAGARFVPIVTFFFAIVLGLIMTLIWPPVQLMIGKFGELVASHDTNPGFIWIYGIIERSLIPFGLHHIFYTPFWITEAGGTWTSQAGEIFNGDLNIWFGQYAAGEALTAGRFMSGKFSFMIFGLPAAALAMYHSAESKNKKIVGGILFSAALTSILTGITEPIEFTFLFVAPLLYVIHSIFAGLSFMLMYILDVHVGMTFSGGLIDLTLYGIIPQTLTGLQTNWLMVIVVGLFYMPLYYFGFRFAITRFDLPTPGRGEAAAELATRETVEKASKATEQSDQILQALGGKDNIETLDACISRLRVTVYDKAKVDVAQLKALGAAGVLEAGNSIQAVFGTKSDQIKAKIQQLLD